MVNSTFWIGLSITIILLIVMSVAIGYLAYLVIQVFKESKKKQQEKASENFPKQEIPLVKKVIKKKTKRGKIK